MRSSYQMAVLYSAGREAAQVSRNRKKSKLEELKMLTANARAEVAEKRERLRHLNRIPSRLVGFCHNIPPPYILQAPASFPMAADDDAAVWNNWGV